MAEDIINVPFTQGVNRKVEEKLLPLGAHTRLLNMYQEKTGTVRVRSGFSNRQTQLVGVGNFDVEEIDGPVSTLDNNLAVHSKGKLYQLSIDTIGAERWLESDSRDQFLLSSKTVRGNVAINQNRKIELFVDFANDFMLVAYPIVEGTFAVNGNDIWIDAIRISTDVVLDTWHVREVNPYEDIKFADLSAGNRIGIIGRVNGDSYYGYFDINSLQFVFVGTYGTLLWAGTSGEVLPIIW